MKKMLTLAVCALMLTPIALMAKDANKKNNDDPLVVGLIMKSLANEFFMAMEEGAQAYAEKDGTFTLKTMGMNSETDFDSQVNAVDSLIIQGVDLIVLAPADSAGMVAPVKRAIDAGVTVINFDVTLDKEALRAAGLPEEFLFVGPDNTDGAEMVGNYLGEALGEGGKVFILEGNPGADNAKQRKNGFMKAIKTHGLELLASNTAHWETEEANTLMSNLLTKHPDVQGVMCANDSMALGVVRALEAAGREDVLVVGFDNIPAVKELILNDKMLATVHMDGTEMAVLAFNAGFEIIEGKRENLGWVQSPLKLANKAFFK
ncbi:MAG: sugar ABC transporter substrate-binding protein [Bacteroidia bacterium]|nr:sugar ABC transporter substrate-binding protein [Bacteroidia bacterium]